MASKEIRDWLETLGTIKQGFEDVSKVREEVKQKDIRSKYLEELPSQFEAAGFTPEMSKLAMTSEQQQPGFANKLLLEQMQKKASATPYTMNELQPYSGKIPGQVLQGIAAQKDRAAQDKALDFYKTQAGVDAKLGMFNPAEDRRQAQYKQGLITGPQGFGTKIQKYEDDIRTKRQALETAKGAIAQGTAPGNAVVLNFIARGVAGEKGPLSEGDITRIMGKSIEGGITGILSYFEGTPLSKWTPEQKKAYSELITLAEEKLGQYQDDTIGNQLNRSKSFYKDLFENDTPDPAIQRIAEQYKFEHQGGGKFAKRQPEKFQLTGDYAKIAAGAKAAGRQDIVDRVVKAQKAGEPLPPAYLQKYGGNQ